VIDVLILQWLGDPGQARAMAQDVAHRQILLAGLRELGPVLRNRLIGIELALIDQTMGAGRRETFGRRVDVDQRVALPWFGLRLVGMTAPDIDDAFTVEIDRASGAELAALFEIF